MNNKELFQNLLALNADEQIGEIYYLTYHENINYAQFLFLKKYHVAGNPLSALTSSSAVLEQQNLQKQFRLAYQEEGLTEQAFFTDGRIIEIEKLLRYINIPKHKHLFFECVCVLEGNCTHFINSYEYVQNKGSFTIIPPGIEHELLPSSDCLCLTIKIKSAAFAGLHVPNLPYFTFPLSFQCGYDSFVKNTLLNIYCQQELSLTYSDMIIEYLYQALVTYLMQNYRDSMQFLITGTATQRKMVEILNYIFENYQTITLNALAKHFHFNESYLSTMFRQQAGKPFSHILREFKLHRAAELLQQTDLKLNDICDAIGYKDTTQFIRGFKEQYGVTPAKYRKRTKEEA